MNEYRVLKPYSSYQDTIIEKEENKRRFRELVTGDFLKCVAVEGLSDIPFMAVHNEMHNLGFSPQNVAARIEQLIVLSLGLLKPLNAESGDALSEEGHRIEIKVSAVFKERTPFYIKALRPFHDLTHYVLHLYDAPNQWCWWGLVPAEELYDLCKHYDYFNGSTSGSKAANAENKNVERQFQVTPWAAKNTKSGKFWVDLQAYTKTLGDIKAFVEQPLPHSNDSFLIPKRASIGHLFA